MRNPQKKPALKLNRFILIGTILFVLIDVLVIAYGIGMSKIAVAGLPTLAALPSDTARPQATATDTPTRTSTAGWRRRAARAIPTNAAACTASCKSGSPRIVLILVCGGRTISRWFPRGCTAFRCGRRAIFAI